MENNFMDFIKPELLIVSVALYLLGGALKNSKAFKDELIPLVLCAFGVVISALWVFATQPCQAFNEVLLALFVSLTQGIIVGLLPVGVNQLVKQLSSINQDVGGSEKP